MTDRQEEMIYYEGYRRGKADAEPKWIPCSERLPSEKGEYLVSYIPCYWDEIRGDVKVGVDTFRGKSAWAKKKFQRVIAWMPFIEPWKGAADEI